MPIPDREVTAPFTSSLAMSLRARPVSGWSGSGTTGMTANMKMLPREGRSGPRRRAVPTQTRF